MSLSNLQNGRVGPQSGPDWRYSSFEHAIAAMPLECEERPSANEPARPHVSPEIEVEPDRRTARLSPRRRVMFAGLMALLAAVSAAATLMATRGANRPPLLEWQGMPEATGAQAGPISGNGGWIQINSETDGHRDPQDLDLQWLLPFSFKLKADDSGRITWSEMEGLATQAPLAHYSVASAEWSRAKGSSPDLPWYVDGGAHCLNGVRYADHPGNGLTGLSSFADGIYIFDCFFAASSATSEGPSYYQARGSFRAITFGNRMMIEGFLTSSVVEPSGHGTRGAISTHARFTYRWAPEDEYVHYTTLVAGSRAGALRD